MFAAPFEGDAIYVPSHPGRALPSQGSCSADGNDVGFLMLQAVVLILALVFTSCVCVVTSNFSELAFPHVY